MAIPPAGIAGLVTGSIGFAITLYKTSLDVYAVLATASAVGEDLLVLQAQFFIQETRFRRWGLGLGFSKGTMDDIDERLRADHEDGGLLQAILTSLSSIKKVLSNVDDLRKIYGVEAKDERTAGNRLLFELQIMSLAEARSVQAEYKDREEEAEKTQKRIGIMKKLRWIIKDKEKFEELLDLLARLNDGLYSLMSPLDASILAKSVADELRRTVEPKWLTALKQAAKATSSTRDIVNLADLRYRAIQIVKFPSQIPDMELPNQSRGLDIEPARLKERRALGMYQHEDRAPQKQAVMIEWKAIDSSASGTSMTRFNSNINALAYFLSGDKRPEYLKSLPCIGVTKPLKQSAEVVRYGLVYSLAGRHLKNDEMPTTLSSMLEDSAQEPDLGDKFDMAQILVQSLHELHVANWFHKCISSDNVLIALTKARRSGKASRFSSSSVFLAGYEFSRPGRLRDPTEPQGGVTRNVYTHPDYEPGQGKYHRWYDIYGVGIILLEIGLWQRATTSITAGLNPSATRDLLVESCDELGPAMGRIYRDAVKMCLMLDFGVDLQATTAEEDRVNAAKSEEEIAILEASDDDMNSKLTESFYWRVVQPLRKLFA